jgi:hypothetical protein
VLLQSFVLHRTYATQRRGKVESVVSEQLLLIPPKELQTGRNQAESLMYLMSAHISPPAVSHISPPGGVGELRGDSSRDEARGTCIGGDDHTARASIE